MYLFGKEKDADLGSELAAFGRELLLSSHLYQIPPRNEGYHLAEIAKMCLDGEENEQTVRDVCGILLETVRSNYSKLTYIITARRMIAGDVLK